MKKKIFCLLFCSLLPLLAVKAQDNPFHTSHRSVYEFLDEMSNLHLIELNSAIKPYSRIFVVEKLNEIENQKDKLNKVQQKELKFHLLEFNIENNAPKSDYKINILPKREHSNICLYPLGGYFSNKWFKYVKQDTKHYKTVKIGVIGKYADLKDAYKSIDESLKISAMEAKVNLDIQYISSEDKNLIKIMKS